MPIVRKRKGGGSGKTLEVCVCQEMAFFDMQAMWQKRFFEYVLCVCLEHRCGHLICMTHCYGAEGAGMVDSTFWPGSSWISDVMKMTAADSNP